MPSDSMEQHNARPFDVCSIEAGGPFEFAGVTLGGPCVHNPNQIVELGLGARALHRAYLSQSVFKVVMQNSISAQIRQLILHHYSYKR